MATKKKTPKKKVNEIEVVYSVVEPNNTIVIDSTRYQKLDNGNYLNKTTNKEVQIKVK